MSWQASLNSAFNRICTGYGQTFGMACKLPLADRKVPTAETPKRFAQFYEHETYCSKKILVNHISTFPYVELCPNWKMI